MLLCSKRQLVIIDLYGVRSSPTYLEQKIIGDGELTIQLATHRIDFFLQFSRVTNNFVDASFLLLDVANDFQYA